MHVSVKLLTWQTEKENLYCKNAKQIFYNSNTYLKYTKRKQMIISKKLDQQETCSNICFVIPEID